MVPFEPLVLQQQQRKSPNRTPSPSHCIPSQLPPLLSHGSTFRISVTQQRRERRAEKLERKRIRKRQSSHYRFSSLNIDVDAFGTYTYPPTSPDPKADGVVATSTPISLCADTTTTTTPTITTTNTVTTTLVTTSPHSNLPSPSVLAFFETKKSFMLREDFHLYGNISNRFLFEKCILVWFWSLYCWCKCIDFCHISQVRMEAEYWWILLKPWWISRLCDFLPVQKKCSTLLMLVFYYEVVALD